MIQHMSQRVSMGDMFELNGIYVNFTMSLTFIKAQGSKEQQARWVDKVQSGDIIVAYCQTELGHGSNVRGLETTATYDLATDEFEIHSPTLTWTSLMRRPAMQFQALNSSDCACGTSTAKTSR